MTTRKSITEVDPQDAVLANASANADPDVPAIVVDAKGQPLPIGPDGLQVLTDAPVEPWTLPDGQSNLIGKHVTLVDDKAGVVVAAGYGPTGLGMIELADDGGTQHAANVVAVRELTAKERKAHA